VFTQAPVNDVGVDAVPQRDGGNGCAWLTALPNNLVFELRTVKTPPGAFGASFARHGVHHLHRAHYRRGSAGAQDVFTGRIRGTRIESKRLAYLGVLSGSVLMDVSEVMASARFAAAWASQDDQAALFDFLSTHDHFVPAVDIALEFMFARPRTLYKFEEVVDAVDRVRGGKLPFAR
jgi:hypothetical protein